MPTKRTPATKKTAVVVSMPVADEEAEELNPAHFCSSCGEMTDVIGEECMKCQTPPVVPDEEPSEDEEEEEEEDDMMTAMAKQQKQMLTEQKINNIKKHFDLIDAKVKVIEAKEEALKEQLRACAEERHKLRSEAEHKASEENKAVQLKLDKVLTFLGEAKTRKTAERKASGEKKEKSGGGFFSHKAPNQIVNVNTRFIYEQTNKQPFRRFCLISKSENCVYECDENNTIIGQPFRSLNDFCTHVKTSINFIGNKKQNANLVLKYYDICSQTYKKYIHLTQMLN
jgi:hypothetical protein